MEPLFLNPAYKDYVWGGNKLRFKFHKTTDLDKLAECWEISANKNGKSVIRNGEHSGKTLDELFKDISLRISIFGNSTIDMEEFPILIKYIDAEKNLSIQVHPDDEYAKMYENCSGKAEVWHIMDCEEDSKIICGINLKGKSIRDIITSDNIEDYFNYINVKKGDTIFISPGTIHAIMGGIQICEIQQNSDITYRLYDWNRLGNDGKPRELHIDKAIDVIKSNNEINVIHDSSELGAKTVIKDRRFNVDRINVDGLFSDSTNDSSFYAYNVLSGDGLLIIYEKTYQLIPGESFIIPAQKCNYEIKGKLKLLKTYM